MKTECDICGAPAEVYWSPWYVNRETRELEVAPGNCYGHLFLCSEHRDSYVEACRKWLAEAAEEVLATP